MLYSHKSHSPNLWLSNQRLTALLLHHSCPENYSLIPFFSTSYFTTLWIPQLNYFKAEKKNSTISGPLRDRRPLALNRQFRITKQPEMHQIVGKHANSVPHSLMLKKFQPLTVNSQQSHAQPRGSFLMTSCCAPRHVYLENERFLGYKVWRSG